MSKKKQIGAAKSKLDTLKQTNGKLDKLQYTTIDQILGDTGLSKYNTLDENEYSARLEGMEKADLQAEAINVAGLQPIDDVNRLKIGLLREFREWVANYQISTLKASPPVVPSKEILKIMSEGR